MTNAPRPLDAALLVAMIVCMAIEVALFTGLTRAAAQGRRDQTRLPTYRYFIIYQWLLVGWIVLVWVVEKRPWSGLLLGMPNPVGFGVCFALAALHSYVAHKQAPAVLKRLDQDEGIRNRVSSVEGITPRTEQERRLWPLAATTAGICEEVIFRGFLLAFVASYTGLIGGVLITSVLFGFFHAYYGWRGILRTGALGLVFALIVLWSGSLIPAMILHVTIDMLSGDVAYQYNVREAAKARGGSQGDVEGRTVVSN